VLEAKSGTKFQLLPLFNIVGPFLGLTKNLGAHHLQYPCIICYSVKHHILNYLKKIENQNMFYIMTNFVDIAVPKDFKFDNVPVNVIVVITTCNQVPEQYALN